MNTSKNITLGLTLTALSWCRGLSLTSRAGGGMSKQKNLFEIALEAGHKCDLCGKELIFMHGFGWDYDIAHCSDRECGAEYKFPTITELKQGGGQ